MPHHKGRNQNNKKSKKGRKQAPATQGSGQQQPSFMQPNENRPSTARGNKKVAPNDDSSTAGSGGYYATYKEPQLERRFEKKNKRRKRLWPRARIMASLALSIRLREKVTAKNFGSKDGGNFGHRYITDVLKYCYSALRFANRMAVALTIEDDDEENEVQKSIGGRLNALTLDDDGDEDEEMDWSDMDRDIKEGNLPRYSGVEIEEEIDIFETLLKGDDRFQALALLCTMDDFMGTI